MDVFAGHEKRIVVEPSARTFAKMVEGRAIGGRTVGKENLRRAAQSLRAELDHRPIVDEVFWKRGRAGQI